MSWSTAVAELRTQLNDGPTDKLRFRKKVLGEQDGSNKIFKTLEFRRVTDLSTPATIFGVFVNNVLASVTSDFKDHGQFALNTAPVTDDLVEATYYAQYFLDAELSTFLSIASRWLLSNADFTKTTDGLQPCVLKYAEGEAYSKLAGRFIEHLSGTYRMEDLPDSNQKSMIADLEALAKAKKEEAIKDYEMFYTRQGRSLQPLFAVTGGKVRDVVPKK